MGKENYEYIKSVLIAMQINKAKALGLIDDTNVTIDAKNQLIMRELPNKIKNNCKYIDVNVSL